MAKNNIKIKPSKKGTFTKAAKKRGKGVQEFASKVLANKDEYSSSMVKKANFAKNASKWNHRYGGHVDNLPQYSLGGWFKGAVKDVGEFTGIKKTADWAGKQVGSNIRKGVKDVTGFAADAFGDYTTLTADTALGVFGAGDVIGKDAYETGVGKGVGEVTSKYVAPVAGQVAANIVAPGVGGQVLGGVQQGVGSAVGQNEQQQMQQQAMQKQQQQIQRQSMANKKLSGLQQNTNYAPTFQDGGEIVNPRLKSRGVESVGEVGVEAPRKFNTRPVYRQHVAKVAPGKVSAIQRRYNATNDKELEEAFNKAYNERGNTEYVADKGSVHSLNRRGEPIHYQRERSPGMGNYVDIDKSGRSLSEEEVSSRFDKIDENVYPTKLSRQRQQELRKEVINSNSAGSRFKKGGKVGDKISKLINEGYDQDQAVAIAYDMKKRGKYQMGGMAGMPNAELEGGESIELPTGQGADVEGPSHAQGGVDMNLPQGTEVYSDELKVPGTDKTFSEANKELTKQMKKYEKVLDSPKATSLATRTAKKMLQKLEAKQDELFQQQQQINGDSNGEQQGQPQVQPQGQAQGQPQFQEGGVFGADFDTLSNVRNANSRLPSRGYLGRNYTPYLDTESLAPMQTPDTSGMDQYNPGISGNLSSLGSMKGLSEGLGTAATVAPALYNIGRGLFGKSEQMEARDFYNPNASSAINRMRNRRLNIDPILESNRSASRIARYNARNAARTRGDLLGAYAPISANRARGDAQAYAQKQQTENQYAGQTAEMEARLGQQRAATDMQIEDMNARARANRRNMLGAGLSQMSQYAQTAQQRRNLQENDQIRIQALKNMFPNVWEKLLPSSN